MALKERALGTRVTTEGLSGKARWTKGEAVQDKDDPVKQDQMWRELVSRERRGALEWEESWDEIKEFYQTGETKPEEPLPNYVSLFSDQVPNTANQIVGSRLNTPLGRELVRLDRLTLWPTRLRKRRPRPRADALLGHSAETSTKQLESRNEVA